MRCSDPAEGRTFMLCEAFTVFLALIGTTLSCMNTGARVTYAMGKDQELPDHFGALHSRNLTPHKRHLDHGRHLGHRRRVDRHHGLRRRRRTRRCHHQSAAPGNLLERRLQQSRHHGRSPEFAAHHHAGLELRHVCSLRA